MVTLLSSPEPTLLLSLQVIESGRHEELMVIEGGTYRTLVGLQTLPGVEDKERGDGNGSGSDEDEEGGNSLPLLPHHSSTRYSENSSSRAGVGSSGNLPEVVVVKGVGKNGLEVVGEPSLPSVPQSRLWQLNRPESGWVTLAIIAATINGCTFPFYSLLLSSIISVLLEPDNDYVKSQVTIWAPLFLALATVVFTCTYTQLYCFTVMGEKMTTRLRDMAFSNTLRWDYYYYYYYYYYMPQMIILNAPPLTLFLFCLFLMMMVVVMMMMMVVVMGHHHK